MDLEFLIKGLVIGFSIAVPVGPIGVLCIQRSLLNGKASGMATGLGAATADAIYGFIAGFGLTIVSNFLVEQKFWPQVIGAAFLIYLGVKTFREKPATKVKMDKSNDSLLFDYISTVGLTLTNPTTILSFIGVFAGLGLANTNGDYLSATILVIGVFLGSAVWWFILSTSVGLLGKKLDQNLLSYANKLSGLIILAFALVIILSLVEVF